MQQRFDTLARSIDEEGAPIQIGNHLFVAHCGAAHQWRDVGHAQSSKTALRNGGDVTARAFDPQHLHMFAGVVDFICFGARVAAEYIHDASIAAQQTTAVDESIECRHGLCVCGVPTMLWHGCAPLKIVYASTIPPSFGGKMLFRYRKILRNHNSVSWMTHTTRV